MLKMLRRRSIPAIAFALAALGALWASPAPAKDLRILAWQGYADDDWVKEFEQQTGAKVNVVFIGTDDEIWAKIKGSEGKDFDLFAVNTAQLQRYIDAGLTTPYDLDKVPNQKETLPRFRDLTKVSGVMRDGKVYAIPFAFDSIGLIYDTDKVMAYDNGEHNFSFTALTLGIENPFHLSADQLQKVKEKLIELKRNVLSFYTTADEALQIYKNNDVALIWANYGQQQMKAMKDAGAHVAYINPKEGALAWLDTWAMTTGVRDKDLAEAWVNFVLQKKIGQQLSGREGFGNTVVPYASAGENDKLVYLQLVEDPTKRSDLWNEIKATP
jgi:putative spermidine/putrescine transport system substrate-binding protein